LAADKYLEIINMKTGALFAVSCELGAELNGAPTHVVKEMREFGSNLGIAYQITTIASIFLARNVKRQVARTDMKKGS
jgi:geranylgeranyl pyrophosphate synthase